MAAWAVKGCRGRMGLLSLLLMVATAFLSAWLDNVTTMLLICPVTISVMRQMNKDPVPLMLSQALMSNIGGAATMVGDPPALIIGTALSNYIGFMDFIVNMAPGVIMASVVCIPLLLWQFRRTLQGKIGNYAEILEEVKTFRILDWPLFAKCSYVTGVVLIGFLLHPVHHVDPAWFAILGAIVLCVVDKPMEVERVVHTVEWDMLLFFASMFVMIEASAEIGMINMIAGWLEDAITAVPEGSRTIVAIQILLWVSAFISMLLDNIPYAITMVPVIEYLASAGLGLDLKILAWALNFGACFGGNGTLIGASANIVTATLAERAGEHISFMQWLKAGIPVTIVSVAMADVWMILRFCL
jgi:Na+/H+ antiporter NhaD/arsenite permease-like protein